MHSQRRLSVSAMYPLFVATVVVHGLGTAHMMGRAQTMQLKHRSSVRVHGGRGSAAIPHGLGNPTFCNGFAYEGVATSLRGSSIEGSRGSSFSSRVGGRVASGPYINRLVVCLIRLPGSNALHLTKRSALHLTKQPHTRPRAYARG